MELFRCVAKRITVLTFFFICLAFSSTGLAQDNLDIIVATDLHYLAPSLTDHGDAFLRLIEAGDGKAVQYIEEITDTFISQVIQTHPDLLVLTGDLTFNGEKESHRVLAEKLSVIKDAGIEIAVLPGNHDLENAGARQFVGDEMIPVDSINAGEFERIYAPFGFDKALFRDTGSLSYVYPLKQDTWLLMLDVNSGGASGAASQELLDWVGDVLKDAGQKGVHVISATHQNLLRHNRLFFDGFQIGNADDLLDLFLKYHVFLNLSGHMHLQHIAVSGNEEGSETGNSSDKEVEDPASHSSVTDIAISALCTYPLHYGYLSLDQEGTYAYDTWEVPVRADLMEEVGNWFLHCTRLKLATEINSLDAPDDVKMELMEKTAAVNRAYFSGALNEFPGGLDGAKNLLALWQEWGPTGLMTIYLISFLTDDEGNNHYDWYTDMKSVVGEY